MVDGPTREGVTNSSPIAQATPAPVASAILRPRAQALAAVTQRARSNPRALTRGDIAHLHRSIGNAAVGRLLTAAAAPNRTGLPGGLKAGVQALSGLSMDDVRVHRDSPEPAALGAHAFARGTEVHLGPGQEQHLPHEAWHVVQQKQGRVEPTSRTIGTPINDDAALGREADVMGARGAAAVRPAADEGGDGAVHATPHTGERAVQRKVGFEFETSFLVKDSEADLAKQSPIGSETHSGFKIVADEAGKGQYELEFVVDPPVDETRAGAEDLAARMDRVSVYGGRLVDAMDASKGAPFDLDAATRAQGDGRYKISPPTGAKDLKAGAQMTTGLDLAQIERWSTINDGIRIPDLGGPTTLGAGSSRFRQALASSTQPIERRVPHHLRTLLTDVSQRTKKIRRNIRRYRPDFADASSNLIGLLVIVDQYLERGSADEKAEEKSNISMIEAGIRSKSSSR